VGAQDAPHRVHNLAFPAGEVAAVARRIVDEARAHGQETRSNQDTELVTENVDVDAYEVMLDSEATAEEVAAVMAAFNDVGLPVRVEATYERKGVGDLPWLIHIGAPIVAVLAVFRKPAVKFGERLADTFGDIADDWLKGLYEARKARRGVVVIEQARGNPEVLLDRDLPPEAWRQLADLVDREALDEIPGECDQIRYEDGAWRRPW
jgi:hypothetical protein